MTKKYTWLVIAILTLLFSFIFAYVYSTPTEGFQDKTDPALLKIIQNLFKSYTGLSSKIKAMGIESKEIEGTTLDQFVQNQMDRISTTGQRCSENTCTEQEIKDPTFLSVYNSANAVGELGFPEITFESLAVESADAQVTSETKQPEMPQAGQAAQANSEMAQTGPETQLPAAQMPASVISSTKPSIDECKKHYRCSISTNME